MPQERTPVAGVPVWALEPDDALSALGSRKEGLSEEEAQKHLAEHGENTLPKRGGASALRILARQFVSPLIFILLGASVITFFLNEFINTAVILLAVLVNTTLGFYQEYKAEHVIEKLTAYIKERARVIRGGVEQDIDSSLVVPGDLIHLIYGARVPADARILSENSLSIDESILTGESLPIHKETVGISEAAPVAERKNMALAGTLVVEGYGTAVVSATGKKTELGRIAELVTKVDSGTPLQRALSRLAWFIFAGMMVLVVIILAIGIARGIPLLEMLLIAAAVAVGAIPEALPVALTVILAIGVERLAKKKGVMRNLAAAETLGSASIVMTDKTGTLTEANMRLTDIRLAKDLEAEHIREHEEAAERFSLDERAILESALLATDAIIENPDDAKDTWRFLGRPIETGILRAASAHGVDVLAALGKRTPPLLPFNSTNKFSVSEENGRLVFVGAPDVLLKRSVLSKEAYVNVEAWMQKTSEDGKRLLGIAEIRGAERVGKQRNKLETANELTFLGVLVFQDPVRTEAKTALAHIESLGARVVMVTGDLKGTAMSVAREVGWNVHEGNILTGEELAALSDDELTASLPNIKIFARITPEDKLRIGRLYQRRGEVVAMTGDGVNDAPSLKAADIGVALGSGSDVAKGVADLVILDDNFKTIVAAIEEGRRILQNIRKAFVYLVANSLDELFLIGGSLIMGLPLPLTALQIIWVNFFTGSLPALSLAFDENYDGGKTGKRSLGAIFNYEVRFLTIFIGLITSFLLFALYWWMLHHGIDVHEARSILFICFASYILVVAFSFRSLRRPLFTYPVFANRFLNISTLIATVLVVITVTVPWFRDLFEIAAPPVELLWIVAAWLVVNVAIVELAKWLSHVFRRE